MWTSIHAVALVSPVAEASGVKFLVKVYSESRFEFLVVDEKDLGRLTKAAERYGYQFKLVSSPDQDLPSVVQTR